MNKFVEVMTEKDTYTANGAITNSTSHDACLDLFFLAGACRTVSVSAIEAKITSAYVQDKIKCLKIIFWAGDIRQGAGERRFFKSALNWLSQNHPEELKKYLDKVPEFSRWDVLFEIAIKNQDVFSFIISKLKDKEFSGYSLLCKWLPRKKQYKNLAVKIRSYLKIDAKQYRKMIVEGTKVVEQKMCAKEWQEIEYSKVPSVAMNKYTKAWYRHDQERITKYLEEVKQGKQKINASAIFPHDIIKSVLGFSVCEVFGKLNEAQIVQWNALPNWLEGKENSIIPVCDVSGSMCGLPLTISVGLGLYISERNIGPFKDAFITFSETPKLEYLKGNINERLNQLIKSEWGCSTNLAAVFELILKKILDNNLTKKEIPETILIISDMEFNTCGNMTNFEYIEKLFEEYKIKLPNIVFWNVNGRENNVPITKNKRGVCLLSGASPSILKAVLTNDMNPINIMNSIIESERYNFIEG